tara:strand:+ start:258 stop:785 length:528 start_codon:yes stop_codon:yes gene_type:complete
MTWTSNGSISERLRALKIQDDLIIKNDPTMAASMMQPPMGVQQPTAEAFARSNEQPLESGQGDYSGIGVAINEAISACDATINAITTANAAISNQSVSGVTADILTAIGVHLSEISTGILANTKHELMNAHTRFNSITQNDATKKITETGAARLQAGTASPLLSSQGNANRLGVM